MDSFILFRHQTTDIRHQSLSGDKLMGTPFHLKCLGQKIKQKNANVLTKSYVYCLMSIVLFLFPILHILLQELVLFPQ